MQTRDQLSARLAAVEVVGLARVRGLVAHGAARDHDRARFGGGVLEGERALERADLALVTESNEPAAFGTGAELGATATSDGRDLAKDHRVVCGRAAGH